MQKTNLTENYKQDLLKSKSTPLLIELTKNDTDIFNNPLFPLVAAQATYNTKENSTNIISIDGDSCTKDDHFYLLETLLTQLKDHVKDIKSTEMLKESIKTAASLAAAGVLGSIFGSQLDKGVDFIMGEIVEGFSDNLIDIVGDKVDISENLNEIEDRLRDLSEDTFFDFMEQSNKKELHLSKNAKEELGELSSKFSKIYKGDIFSLTIKLLLTTCIDSPKLLFINNPHKLDSSSISIISLMLSYAKYQKDKDKDKHIGLSIVYTYSDEKFQPYTQVEKKYEEKKELLDQQRSFSQRYAMLERPSSDIPKVAVKSSLFIGRKDELEELKENYDKREKTTLSAISADPGVGKTALAYKHLEQIQKSDKMIRVTLLNEVGHSSSSTGISSLEKSIIEEARRLNLLKGWKEKGIDFLKSYATKEGVVDTIGSILGIDKAIDTIKATYNFAKVDDDNMSVMQESIGHENQENQKEQQFANLNTAMIELQKLSDKALPIILFIDDMQWIDELSSEYILAHLSKNFDLYIVATLRPSDASTKLKKLQESQTSNEHAIALLKALHVKDSDKVDSNIDIAKLNTKTIKLKGFDKTALNELLTEIIKGKKEHLEIIAKTIIEQIGEKDDKEINTLFAIETINMLCDEKLYSQHNQTRVILDNPLKVDENITDIAQTLKVNENITDIEQTLKDTFAIVKERYKASLSHYNKRTDNHHFTLMAYAVLEERLRILKLYFNEKGNAAVNTLLFSSLLGAPFSSNIVKNVLQTLSNTEEPLLEPLKLKLTEDTKEINLTEEHYSIIDEVYEILSRYVSYDSAYMYRHSLLHIFLDRQLDYMLETTLKESQQEAKDKMFELVIKEIKQEEEKQDFYGEPEQSLDTKKYANMLFFRTTEQSVLKKAYESNPIIWTDIYIRSLNDLTSLYMINNQISKAIQIGDKAFQIIEKLFEKNQDDWAELYVSNLDNLANSYKKQNQLSKAIWLGEKALQITEKLYDRNSNDWVGYYIESLNTLTILYSQSTQFSEAIKLGEKAFKIMYKLFPYNPTLWSRLYLASNNNLATSYQKDNQIFKSIELEKNTLSSVEERLYKKDPDFWAKTYIAILNSLAVSYYKINKPTKAIEIVGDKAIKITEKLYDRNSNIWAEDYAISLSNLANLYKINNQIFESIKLDERALKVRKELYDKSPTAWAGDYTRSLINLAGSYSNSNQLPKAIELEKEALEIRKELYENNPTVWAKNYTTSLDNLAGSKAKMGDFKEAGVLLQQYFDIYNFEQQDNIAYFMYPFIKWYQCEMRLNNQNNLDKLDALGEELKILYKKKLGDSYINTIEKERKEYMDLKDSKDSMDTEKYDIFVKLFVE